MASKPNSYQFIVDIVKNIVKIHKYMESTLEAPSSTIPAAPAEAAEAPVTPGPKEFTPSHVKARSSETLDEALHRHAGQLPKPPEERQPAKPKVEDKKPDPKADAKEQPPKEEKTADGKIVPHGTTDKTKPKVNPWNELKSVRQTLAERERELETVRKQITPDNDRTALTTRMEHLTKENERLANIVRFKDYENSHEFIDKYHKPYEERLAEATEFLKRIPVPDEGTGGQRAANQNDLFELMQIDSQDPAKAIDAAEAKFGKLAGRVLERMERVRDVLIARNQALAKEKTDGASREQLQREQRERQTKQLMESFTKEYTAEHESFISNPKDSGLAEILKAIEIPEGKQPTPEETEHNDALKRGYELVDKWIGKHPSSAKTPEERREIVKRHIAIRNRAAGFGPLRRLYNRTKAELTKAKAELASYDQTAPETGGRRTNGGNGKSAKGSSFDADLTAGLMKYAGRR